MSSNDKTEYVLNSLSKLSSKATEQYVISRIIHRLDDLSIEFVCQQHLSPDGSGYMLDMFFPQFLIYLEVHEKFHGDTPQKEKDNERKNAIEDAYNLELHVIETYDKDHELICLEEINRKVDEFVTLLRKLKAEQVKVGKFAPWNFEKRFSPNYHARNGVIKIDDNITLRKQVEVIEMFGVKLSALQRGAWAWKGTEYDIWFPKFYNSKGWSNEFSKDGKFIYERSKLGKRLNHLRDAKSKRIVFPHFKDQFGGRYYKFFGVFEIDRKASEDDQTVYRRIATSVSLNK